MRPHTSREADSDEEIEEEKPQKTTSIFNKKPYLSKKISAKTPLESIKETNGTSPHKSSSSSMCFGIKSYLHEFYESDISQTNELAYLIRKRRKLKRMRLVWLIATWIGVICLILGTSLLIFGYSMKDKPANEQFNYYLECSRVFGLILFAIGSLILTVCLLLPSFVCQDQCFVFNKVDDDSLWNEPSISFGTDTSQSSLFKKSMNYQVVEPQSFKSN